VITRVPGILVGQATDLLALTGCTVVLCPPGTVGSGVVRGGAPGTRETDLLRPGTLVEEVHAVLLTGGSAFGLAAADGVMRWLEERGIGFPVGEVRVPIVPAAVVFDLSVGDGQRRPGPEDGYAACEAASVDVEEGNVGAGTGATVAKLEGPERSRKGGVGSASGSDGDLIVGAIAVVNAVGEIVEDDGTVIAGPRRMEAPAVGGEPPAEEEGPPQLPFAGNTTLVVAATNARLSKDRAQLLALAGHEGLARAVRPSHTMVDGDTVFSLATGEVDSPQPQVERLATEATADAIRRAVRAAEPIAGIPGIGGP